MITGSEYLLHGQRVTVTCQWHGKSNPDLPRLQTLLPLVRLKATGPRNVLIRLPDGRIEVRPFRGMRKEAPHDAG